VRQRLTASFVVLSVVLVLGALALRTFTTDATLEAHTRTDLSDDAETIAVLVEQRVALERPVDRGFLRPRVRPDDELVYAPPTGTAVTVAGREFLPDERRLSTSIPLDTGGSLRLTTSSTVVDEIDEQDRTSLVYLLLLVAILAAMSGYVAARLLSRPFSRLAGAAEQLGRGRFDLDLPRTRIPEARAIGQALLTSAGQLQERLASEQAFAEHASHVLRTPLTGMRIELEELAARDDVPADVRESAARSIGRIEAVDAVAGDLVSLARRSALVSGAEIPLRDLATACAQTWADALDEQDRALTAAVEGAIDITYTPGPVEHILDLLLTDVLRRGAGPVRLVFDADPEGHLRIDLSGGSTLRSVSAPLADIPITQARAVVTALGGRMTGEDPRKISILLPRR
jgi:signal transduction histidine kinase